MLTLFLLAGIFAIILIGHYRYLKNWFKYDILYRPFPSSPEKPKCGDRVEYSCYPENSTGDIAAINYKKGIYLVRQEHFQGNNKINELTWNPHLERWDIDGEKIRQKELNSKCKGKGWNKC